MPVPAAILSEPARRFATATCRAWLAAGLVLAQVEALDGFRASAAWVSRSRRALRRRTWRGQARRIARPAARRAVSG